MAEISRRGALGLIAAGATQLLFSRTFVVNSAGQVIKKDLTAPAGSLNLTLTSFSPKILAISIAPANDAVRPRELGVLSQTKAHLLTDKIESQKSLTWGKYKLKVTEAPLTIAAYDGDRLRQQIHFDLDSTDIRFLLKGPIFGLGEGAHPFDRRGTRDAMLSGSATPDLITYGARLPIPWVMSPEGWGVFIGQPSGAFEFSEMEAWFRGVEATSTRNVYLVLGDTPAEVLAGYAELTGHPHLPPKWSFGYQQSHRTLKDREEIVAVAQTFRDKKLPCDALIYLGTGFCPSGWNTGHGSFTFNERVFPDPEHVMRTMHDRNLKVILHVVPPGDLHGDVADTGVAADEPGDAPAYWQKHVPVARTGVDGWWPDEGDRLSVYARLQRNKLYWDGSKQFAPDKRPFALHRNGYAGMQRYGWLWSGDTFSTWKALHAQIMVGINIGLSGMPYWGTDTGGFVPTAEYTPELFVRWFQFSTFCPSFRSHGRAWKLHLPWGWNTGETGPKEVEGSWVASWPEQAELHRPEIEAICRKFLHLRYQLLPYSYSAAAEAHTTGMPMIRALWLAYPQQQETRLVDDQYLWGASILVSPVFEKGATARKVLLPGGRWWDFWTAQSIAGGQTITAPVSLDGMPLFVKAGSIVPMDPVRQYTAEAVNEPTTLHIYPGANGRFTWYDDAGDGFAYERGEYMRVECEWYDAERKLTLRRDAAGSMGAGRPFKAHAVDSKKTADGKLDRKTISVNL